MEPAILQAGMFGVGPQEMMYVLIIVLIIFGPKNLPKLASAMGRAIRDFKSGLAGVDDELRKTAEEADAPVETRALPGERRDIRTGETRSAETGKTDRAD